MNKEDIESKYDEFFGTGLWESDHKKHIVEFTQQCLKSQLSSEDQEGWISVKDRLPDLGKPVLVVQNPKLTATKFPLYSSLEQVGDELKFRSYAESGQYRSLLGYWVEITHWMSLPNPPNK